MTEISDELRCLRNAFRVQLPERLAHIEEAWNAVSRGGGEGRDLAHLHHLVHTLTGTAHTFGFNAVGEVAGDMELLAESLEETCSAPSAEVQAQLESRLQRMRELVRSGKEDLAGDDWMTRESPGAADWAGRGVVLLESERDFGRCIQEQLGHFGYGVTLLPSVEELEGHLRNASPEAIVADIRYLTGGEEQRARFLSALKRSQAKILFVADTGDFEPRLDAVRAGASAYFTRPVEVNRLVDALDVLAEGGRRDPYRVLIAEDDPPLARYYARVLQAAGVETRELADPSRLLEVLVDYSPDLILMDLYMRHCSGVELAQVVRQHEAFLGTPIVFLSVEENPRKQLAAIGYGADDFLTKPVEPGHLVASLTHRIRRARALQSYMIRDSLTGLVNHSRLKEQLELEVVRAGREKHPLVVAMLDVDHFKNVNDRYGHSVGDHVLKGLSRYLVQHLRRTDVVGRYGGEEFVVILLNTSLDAGAELMDKVRAGFAQIAQLAGTEEIRVTFSAGLASYPEFEDASSLIDAADRAMYEAKRAGRNRVQVSR